MRCEAKGSEVLNTTRFLPSETRGCSVLIRAVNESLAPINTVNFMKMAHGDVSGLRDLAFDYFNDTRRLMTVWLAMIEAENFTSLREGLHRCKRGASLFGLERIVAMIGECERPQTLERDGFDLALFERELSAAENAVIKMAEAD